MRALFRTFARINRLLGLLTLVLLLAGCSLFDSSTSSTTTDTESSTLWNPQSGDQIIPGRDVPILNPGYWEQSGSLEVNPNSASAVIGPEGGKLKLGKHKLQVPAGAVSEPTLFTMEYASETGVAVDCGPSPFTFNCPVTLTLSFENTQYDGGGGDPSQLQIFWMAEDGHCEPMPSDVDIQGKKVVAELSHFSRYIIS
jgi:hypothetical protein